MFYNCLDRYIWPSSCMVHLRCHCLAAAGTGSLSTDDSAAAQMYGAIWPSGEGVVFLFLFVCLEFFSKMQKGPSVMRGAPWIGHLWWRRGPVICHASSSGHILGQTSP